MKLIGVTSSRFSQTLKLRIPYIAQPCEMYLMQVTKAVCQHAVHVEFLKTLSIGGYR